MSSTPLEDRRFIDRVIIITGAGGNFGREGCLYFAQAGAKVVALDNNALSLTETINFVKEECAQKVDPKIISFECDVTERISVENAIENVCQEWGVPDLLWNNAGYQGKILPTLEYDIEDFARVMDINVTGMFSVLQVVSKRMAKAKEDGFDKKFSIVNTASVAAMRGTPAMIAYSSSKAAVLAMTVASAKDLAPHGIRVNAVSPALIGPGFMWDRQNDLHAKSNSPYFATDPLKVAEGKINSVPMKRLGTIHEVVKSVAFLLSDESSYTTAFNLVVDGGLSGGIH